jgi:4-amino-4-deoxy-L-arabinose transferase-like glycosyltransferase
MNTQVPAERRAAAQPFEPALSHPRLAGWLAIRPLAIGVTLLVLLGLALVPRFSGLELASTADEGYWIQRSLRFGAALARGDLKSTYRTGHPGVTVMWLGTLGIGPDRLEAFLPTRYTSHLAIQTHPEFLPTFHAARAAIAVATSLLAVGVIFLAWRLLGPGPALLGGGLLLIDPYLIGMSRVLHPDALLGWLMAASALAGLIYFQAGGRWPYLLISGLAGGLATLTKAPAAFISLYSALIGLTSRRWPLGGRLARVGLWGLLALGIYVALWPALWVNFFGRIANVIQFTLRIGGQPHSHWPNYFLGQAFVGDPGLAYYPIALAFRLSPVVLVGLALLPLALIRALPHRSRLLWMGAYVLLFMLFMAPAPKKLDRYMVPAQVMLDLLAGAGYWWLLASVRPRALRAAALGAPLLVQALLCWQSYPYPIAYYNPLLGGAVGAQRAMIVGWGEGLDQVATYLNARPNAESAVASVHYEHVFRPRFRGTTARPLAPVEIDYLILYVNMRQRLQVLSGPQRDLIEQEPVFIARVNGVDFAWVYRASPPLLQALPSTELDDEDDEEST